MRNLEGQAVLIVLLSMVVVLTVVLSVIAASTSDIKIGSSEGASLRAFSAAESGVEQALVSNSAASGNVNSGATYNTSVTPISSGSKTFVYPTKIVNGDSAIFWFVSHATDGSLSCTAGNNCYLGNNNINVCWGTPGTDPSSATAPAVEISIYYLSTPGNFTTGKVARQFFDPNSTRRGTNSANSTNSGTCTIGTTTFAFHQSIDIDGSNSSAFKVPASANGAVNGMQFMTVRSLYNSDLAQPIGIDVTGGAGTLPSQGSVISSIGNTGETTRKIEVKRSYNQIPPIFESAIFSPVSLAQ